MDRDVNAAHNILELYHSYPDRPPEMTRGGGRIPRLGYTIVVKTPKTLCADGAEKPRNRRPKQPDARNCSYNRTIETKRRVSHFVLV